MTYFVRLRVIFALILSIIVFILVYNYLNALREDTVILVAARDIEERKLIKLDMLEEITIGKKEKLLLAPGAFASLAEIGCAVSNTSIKRGDVLLNGANIISGTREYMVENGVILENGEINNQYFIPDNSRIIGVRTDSQGAVSNRLRKGDYVDVIFTSETSGSEKFTTTIMQKVQVYDVEKVEDSGSGFSQDILLLITPQQAVDLAFAKRSGKIDLALSRKDAGSATVETANIATLLGN